MGRNVLKPSIELHVILMLLIANSTFAQFSFSGLGYVDIESSSLGRKFGFSKISKFQLINKFVMIQ
jgi:hypothetical protein